MSTHRKDRLAGVRAEWAAKSYRLSLEECLVVVDVLEELLAFTSKVRELADPELAEGPSYDRLDDILFRAIDVCTDLGIEPEAPEDED